MAERLFDKIWDRHVVATPEGEPPLLSIDMHLVHEVTSPQAFEGIELAGRKVRRPDLTVATMEHDAPTTGLDKPIADELAAQQIEPAAMSVTVDGELGPELTAKDLVLGIIRALGTGGGVGSVIEYRGAAVRALSMQGRVNVCNMYIERGARAARIAPDDTTFAFLEGRQHSPKGRLWEQALDDWRSLATDDGAEFDREIRVDAAALRPAVTWGTNPAQSVTIDDLVPDPSSMSTPELREGAERALAYMGLTPGTAIRDIPVDTVFIGSCTNGRLEDLRAAADVARGRKISSGVRALIVPGSARVKAEAEAEGVERGFTDAGFEWRSAGCSMCLGMNGDILAPGQRSASTSNRNFEGRQGPGGRTHLVSPAVAAATAVAGHFSLPGDL